MYIDFKALYLNTNKCDINGVIYLYKSFIKSYISRQDYLKVERFVKRNNKSVYSLIAKRSIMIFANRLTRGFFLYLVYICMPIFYRRRLKQMSFTSQSTSKMHRKIIKRYLLNLLHLTKLDKEMSEIKKNKNIHLGKRCFIVCTGPSLRFEDLDMLEKEYTFSMNTIIDAFPKTSWRPTYYVLQDYNWSRINNFKIYGGKCAKEKAFFNDVLKSKIKNLQGTFLLFNYKNNLPLRRCLKIVTARKDISLCVYDCFTVTNTAIQIALYMGFKKIYLIGADCNYTNRMHFLDEKEKSWVDAFPQKERNMILDDVVTYHISGYKCIKNIAKKFGATIYNATRGGNLEVFERVNFDDLF